MKALWKHLLCAKLSTRETSVFRRPAGGLPHLPRGPLTASLLPPLVPHHSASVLGVTSPSLPQAIDSLCPQLSAVILWLLSSFLRSLLKPRGPSISLLASSVTPNKFSHTYTQTHIPKYTHPPHSYTLLTQTHIQHIHTHSTFKHTPPHCTHTPHVDTHLPTHRPHTRTHIHATQRNAASCGTAQPSLAPAGDSRRPAWRASLADTATASLVPPFPVSRREPELTHWGSGWVSVCVAAPPPSFSLDPPR